MEYMLKVLNLEKEIDKLKIVNQGDIEYIDLKKRLKNLDSFAQKISEADMRESDRYRFLERVKEYKSRIEQYKAKTGSNNAKSDTAQTIISFLLGIFSVVVGVKLKEMYEFYRVRRMAKEANFIYEKLSGVEATNE